jgi:hypothetical protein
VTYEEKIAELTQLLADVDARIERCKAQADTARAKYGRAARRYGHAVPHGLYVEQARLRQEIEAANYAGSMMT